MDKISLGSTMRLEIPDELFTEEALKNTQNRWNKFMKEWEDTKDFNFTVFNNPDYDQMIILKDIEFASLCEHHCLPFHGKIHIGYIPDENICGISKLARVVDKFACKPQLQEALTQEIADYLEATLEPKGVIVVVEATHDCMRIRGVKKQNSVMVTSAIKGRFVNAEAKIEFLRLIK